MSTRTLSDYFEAMTAAVFQSGLSAQVVQAKWPGFVEAFAGFDPRIVAEFTPEDVDRLVSDESIVRNRRKIEATIDNASRILDLDQDGGFDGWLDSFGNDEARAEGMRNEFRFLGPSGVNTFFHMVSDDREVC
ncbi:MAG: DNA-3-methyladenine glycosylase I [Acidimicrobiia bacterium]|nr:DNA-3-methyladenine glycosylase I [Acidimicrobiia bacterium]